MKKRVLAIVFIIIFYIINPSESRTVVESGCIKDRRLYAINYDWWKKFNDPYLTDYICKTVQNNHSLKSATLKTKESSRGVRLFARPRRFYGPFTAETRKQTPAGFAGGRLLFKKGTGEKPAPSFLMTALYLT